MSRPPMTCETRRIFDFDCNMFGSDSWMASRRPCRGTGNVEQRSDGFPLSMLDSVGATPEIQAKIRSMEHATLVIASALGRRKLHTARFKQRLAAVRGPQSARVQAVARHRRVVVGEDSALPSTTLRSPVTRAPRARLHFHPHLAHDA